MKNYAAIGAILLVGVAASGCKAESTTSIPICVQRGGHGECQMMLQDGRLFDVAPMAKTGTWPTSSGDSGGMAGFEEDILNTTTHIPCDVPRLARFSMCGVGSQAYFDGYDTLRAAADKAEANCLSVVVVNNEGHIMHRTRNPSTRCDW